MRMRRVAVVNADVASYPPMMPVGVLSGCAPVIFGGGMRGFGEEQVEFS